MAQSPFDPVGLGELRVAGLAMGPSRANASEMGESSSWGAQAVSVHSPPLPAK